MTKTKITAVLTLAASALVSACGDSSGPGSVDANSALQSLAIALQQGEAVQGSLTTPDISSALSTIAPLLTRASVVVNGVAQPMFAIGLRESFPPGTCEENLYVDPAFPPTPGVCTPPTLNTALIFWQSHSANELPDRLLFVVTDPGTINFDFNDPSGVDIPALAIYTEGQDKIWVTESGSITSNITSLNQPCSITLPPYAKTATCSISSFDEQGQLVFGSFDLSDQPSTAKTSISIPRQTLPGLWLAISETQPVAIPLFTNRIANRVAPRLGRIAAGMIGAR